MKVDIHGSCNGLDLPKTSTKMLHYNPPHSFALEVFPRLEIRRKFQGPLRDRIVRLENGFQQITWIESGPS